MVMEKDESGVEIETLRYWKNKFKKNQNGEDLEIYLPQYITPETLSEDSESY